MSGSEVSPGFDEDSGERRPLLHESPTVARSHSRSHDVNQSSPSRTSHHIQPPSPFSSPGASSFDGSFHAHSPITAHSLSHSFTTGMAHSHMSSPSPSLSARPLSLHDQSLTSSHYNPSSSVNQSQRLDVLMSSLTMLRQAQSELEEEKKKNCALYTQLIELRHASDKHASVAQECDRLQRRELELNREIERLSFAAANKEKLLLTKCEDMSAALKKSTTELDHLRESFRDERDRLTKQINSQQSQYDEREVHWQHQLIEQENQFREQLKKKMHYQSESLTSEFHDREIEWRQEQSRMMAEWDAQCRSFESEKNTLKAQYDAATTTALSSLQSEHERKLAELNEQQRAEIEAVRTQNEKTASEREHEWQSLIDENQRLKYELNAVNEAVQHSHTNSQTLQRAGVTKDTALSTLQEELARTQQLTRAKHEELRRMSEQISSYHSDAQSDRQALVSERDQLQQQVATGTEDFYNLSVKYNNIFSVNATLVKVIPSAVKQIEALMVDTANALESRIASSERRLSHSQQCIHWLQAALSDPFTSSRSDSAAPVPSDRSFFAQLLTMHQWFQTHIAAEQPRRQAIGKPALSQSQSHPQFPSSLSLSAEAKSANTVSAVEMEAEVDEGEMNTNAHSTRALSPAPSSAPAIKSSYQQYQSQPSTTSGAANETSASIQLSLWDFESLTSAVSRLKARLIDERRRSASRERLIKRLTKQIEQQKNEDCDSRNTSGCTVSESDDSESFPVVAGASSASRPSCRQLAIPAMQDSKSVCLALNTGSSCEQQGRRSTRVTVPRDGRTTISISQSQSHSRGGDRQLHTSASAMTKSAGHLLSTSVTTANHSSAHSLPSTTSPGSSLLLMSPPLSSSSSYLSSMSLSAPTPPPTACASASASRAFNALRFARLNNDASDDDGEHFSSFAAHGDSWPRSRSRPHVLAASAPSRPPSRSSTRADSPPPASHFNSLLLARLDSLMLEVERRLGHAHC